MTLAGGCRLATKPLSFIFSTSCPAIHHMTPELLSFPVVHRVLRCRRALRLDVSRALSIIVVRASRGLAAERPARLVSALGPRRRLGC
jgi:hypothetical protein